MQGCGYLAASIKNVKDTSVGIRLINVNPAKEPLVVL